MTTLPNPHHPTSEELFAYRDGELPVDRRLLIEAHVLACAQCGERIDEMSAAEADLRQRPDAVEEEYFERMTESVMVRLGSPAPAVAAREVEPAPVRPGGAGGGRVLSEVPPVDRRRSDYAQVGEGEPRRRLRLPWIGVAGGAAAAVAVVVVAVILFQRQGEWLNAPRPAVLGRPIRPSRRIRAWRSSRRMPPERGTEPWRVAAWSARARRFTGAGGLWGGIGQRTRR